MGVPDEWSSPVSLLAAYRTRLTDRLALLFPQLIFDLPTPARHPAMGIEGNQNDITGEKIYGRDSRINSE